MFYYCDTEQFIITLVFFIVYYHGSHSTNFDLFCVSKGLCSMSVIVLKVSLL